MSLTKDEMKTLFDAPFKYPKTQHLKGSKGVTETGQVALPDLDCDRIIIEEKLDGAEVAIGFNDLGGDYLRNRNSALGHFQFDPFHTWFYPQRESLRRALGEAQHILFGEWLFAKHTVYYDALPSYFMAFDIYDIANDKWLTTQARRDLLDGTGTCHVPVLYEGPVEEAPSLDTLIRPSLYKTENWETALREQCESKGYLWEKAQEETDFSKKSEGLYVKAEKGDEVVGFYKYIREGFLRTIIESGSHWASREIIPNRIAHEGTHHRRPNVS